MIILPVSLEDRFFISDSCEASEDSQAIDFINKSTQLWLTNRLDTDTYLDIVQMYFSVEQHIEYLERLMHQVIG